MQCKALNLFNERWLDLVDEYCVDRVVIFNTCIGKHIASFLPSFHVVLFEYPKFVNSVLSLSPFGRIHHVGVSFRVRFALLSSNIGEAHSLYKATLDQVSMHQLAAEYS